MNLKSHNTIAIITLGFFWASCQPQTEPNSADEAIGYYENVLFKLLEDAKSYHMKYGTYPDSVKSKEFLDAASFDIRSYFSDEDSNTLYRNIWSFFKLNLKLDDQRVFFIVDEIFYDSSEPSFIICTKHGGIGLVSASKLLRALEPENVTGDPDDPDSFERTIMEAEAKLGEKFR